MKTFKNLFLDQQVKTLEKLPRVVYHKLIGEDQILPEQIRCRHPCIMHKLEMWDEWTCSKLPGAKKCFSKDNDYEMMDGWACKSMICQKDGGQNYTLCSDCI